MISKAYSSHLKPSRFISASNNKRTFSRSRLSIAIFFIGSKLPTSHPTSARIVSMLSAVKIISSSEASQVFSVSSDAGTSSIPASHLVSMPCVRSHGRSLMIRNRAIQAASRQRPRHALHKYVQGFLCLANSVRFHISRIEPYSLQLKMRTKLVTPHLLALLAL